MNSEKWSMIRQVVGPIALTSGVCTLAILATVGWTELSIENYLTFVGIAETLLGLVAIGIRPIRRSRINMTSILIAVAVVAILLLVLRISSTGRFVVVVLILALLRLELALLGEARELIRSRRWFASLGVMILFLSAPYLLYGGVGITDTLLFRLENARVAHNSAIEEMRISNQFPSIDPRNAEHRTYSARYQDQADHWYDAAWHIFRPDERLVVAPEERKEEL